ncbi:glycosyltransferase [Saccharicrinis sp. GN24d3]|uniref:glycosyltransferase n=1 Tax=Saccharicrinis sp. GN24d3 TaxID=3458416 RepID=UPI0040358B3F
MKQMEDYLPIVGEKEVYEIYQLASRLYEKHLLHVNSTFIGGGVAEILNNLVPLSNDIGLDTGWRVLHGNLEFYNITKKMHNGLQGSMDILHEEDKRNYLNVNSNFATYTHFDHDCIVIHDPQPLSLIKYIKKSQPWIWRCHIDITHPNPEYWEFIKPFILRYDVMIVSAEKYKKKDIPVEQRIIHPAIDPLAPKNIELSELRCKKILKDAGIPTDKPIISQVSRMDKWKDPEGVLNIFELVKKRIDCRLLYMYNLATDDPEGVDIFNRIKHSVKNLPFKDDILFVLGNNDYLVNAVQRYSDVVIQKSLREGFCLCVTEAMWKGTPVVASNVGGIPVQIDDGENGFLFDPNDCQGFADCIIELMQNKKLSEMIGKSARDNIKRKFLLPRLLKDYLILMHDVLK